MGRKRTAGLYKRGGVWHIDKQVRGCRLCESTGESSLTKAEEYLAKKVEEIRQQAIYGVRPKRTFRQAATEHLNRCEDKASIAEDAMHLQLLDPYIGGLALDQVHMGTLNSFIVARQKARIRNPDRGVKNRTINYSLQVVRRILHLAAHDWRDQSGLTWLAVAPKIRFLPESDRRKPYPMSWEEQSRLLRELPPHLQRMALFRVNSGCREAEVCGLRWDWEVRVPELDTIVFLIPEAQVKNREERLVVLNRIARSVIDEQRGQHAKFVFTYHGCAIQRMNGNAWRQARKRAELPEVRVHDLKHTFGRRLRAAGVSFEDRQDLLGHKSGRITTHYSAAELHNLIEAANRVSDENSRKSPALTILNRKTA